MRLSSLAIGCALAFAMTGTALADQTVRAEFRFSRPQTNVRQFHNDLRGCQFAAKRVDWHVRSLYSGTTLTRINTSAGALQTCMGEKGYRLDPNGYRTGWMRMSA